MGTTTEKPSDLRVDVSSTRLLAATGKCAKCGKQLALGTDGACTNCNAETCWDCWTGNGHECPQCGNFNAANKQINEP